ncbi:MAG: glutamate formimidoyltransferase [Planctomycetota bacterium]|jgi:glutamate formiminotransferase
MDGLLECVPNISEGRDAAKVRNVAAAFASSGATLLGIDSDADHHRSVITLAGTPDELVRGVVAGAIAARDAIDLTRHEGAHPRMGAVDVVPFVPLGSMTMADAVAAAGRAAAAIAEEVGVPTYLYGEAARRPERKNLAKVRRGQFEKIRELIGSDPDRAPDFGPRQVHPTAGATAVGARFFLIAFNVNLKTTDVAVAKQIAVEIREKDGGLPAVKAMGFDLPEKGQVQVSMNLVDYRKTSPVEVFQVIAGKAEAAGVEVAGSEVVGLIPQAAVPEGFAETVRLEDFDPEQIVEQRLARMRGSPA